MTATRTASSLLALALALGASAALAQELPTRQIQVEPAPFGETIKNVEADAAKAALAEPKDVGAEPAQVAEAPQLAEPPVEGVVPGKAPVIVVPAKPPQVVVVQKAPEVKVAPLNVHPKVVVVAPKQPTYTSYGYGYGGGYGSRYGSRHNCHD